METTNRVPNDWFIDPLLLGVAKAYSDPENNPLSWQADAVCAQTDPEAFFPEKGGVPRVRGSQRRAFRHLGRPF